MASISFTYTLTVHKRKWTTAAVAQVLFSYLSHVSSVLF